MDGWITNCRWEVGECHHSFTSKVLPARKISQLHGVRDLPISCFSWRNSAFFMGALWMAFALSEPFVHAIVPLSHFSIEPLFHWAMNLSFYQAIKSLCRDKGRNDGPCEKYVWKRHWKYNYNYTPILLLVVIPPFTYSIYPQWYSLVAYSVINRWGHVAKCRRKE